MVVLPLLVEDVPLPGFLKGKLYADFRQEDSYETTLDKLLMALGPAKAPDPIGKDELEKLKEELKAAQKVIQHHTRDRDRARSAITSNWSEKLRKAVDAANLNFPQHKPINEAYAFEVLNMPITLDYILWAVAKSQRRGGHPLEMGFTIEDKWPDAQRMLDAYKDYLELNDDEDGA